MKILTVTMNPTIDMNTQIGQVVPEVKMRPNAPTYEPGGGGINVSRVIHILGGKSTAFYTAGGFKSDLLQHLVEKALDKQIRFHISGLTRLNFNVLEENSDQQYRFSMPGPELEEGEWHDSLERIGKIADSFDFVVASGSLPRGVPDDFYARLARLFTGHSTKVIVDTRANMLRSVAQEEIFLLKPNVREFQHLIGSEITDEAGMIDAAHDFLKISRISHMVISLGAGGALLISNGNAMHIHSPTVPIKSKVGAGYSMLAGIVHQLSEGRALDEAVQYGVAAGASAVMTPGTQLCTKEAADRIFAKIRGKN